MTHRFSAITMAICLLILTNAPVSRGNSIPMDEPDYSRLLSYIELQDLQDPLVAFGGAEQDFDRKLNKENIAYLNQQTTLIENIQTRLQGEPLKWKLNTSFKQLLVVPENRDEYAQLFEAYCKASIDYLLDRIQMPNPYENIATIRGPLASLPDQGQKGITAYLVHNLADEYIEEYLFFNQDEHQKNVKIKLSNREFDGKIGSYTSRLKIGENNQFEFIRESYTLWQNSAKNPLNVLIVPIEETLHILLRPSTEAAIHLDLIETKPARLNDVQHIIDEWMAVEEAMVGGVVRQVMPDVLSRFVHTEAAGQLTQALAERKEHSQYRLLNQGIRLVFDLGVDATLSIYKNNPEDFKQLLTRKAADTAIESAQAPPQFPALIN